jgi:arylsulfatase A-like enzyme
MKLNIFPLALAALTPCLADTGISTDKEKPNVVLIVCDDLNTDLQGYGGHPEALTANLDRLMESGVSFMQAHCNIPICAPSRGSFLTGIYPHTSRYYDFSQWFENETLVNSKSIFRHFRDNGYHVIGTGKLFHHYRQGEFDAFENDADYGPFALLDGERVPHPMTPEPLRSEFGWVDGSLGPFVPIEGRDFGDGKSYSWGTGNWRGNRDIRFDDEGLRVDPTADELNGQWAVQQLEAFAKDPGGKPFFMAVGYLRPHTPLIVDQRFFDKFPLDSLDLPVILDGDVEDTFLTDSRGGNDRGRQLFDALVASYDSEEEALRRWVQAYLACVNSVDELIGSMMDVIDNSALRENTIVIVTSDHGWGNGQKDYLYKNALWEESTRVPLIIRAPGMAVEGGEVSHPVSLIDLYPTLVDLCNLSTDTKLSEKGADLDGFSLKPFLVNPEEAGWHGPDSALTVIHKWEDFDPAHQSYSLRSKDWRYIRYHTGKEELYDKRNDPYEWHNLAGRKEFSKVLKDYRAKLEKQLDFKLTSK